MDAQWIEIQSEYDAMEKMSCVPIGMKRVNANHVFDEDKSVKWNREQAEANNLRHQQEVARLNREKNKRRDAIHERIYQAIQDEVGHGISRRKAMLLWNYAYEKGHSCGIMEVKDRLDELMELAAELLGKEKS